jgi:hypothetical protein
VTSVDVKVNTVIVDAAGKTVTYHPKRLHGVSVFKVEDRWFAWDRGGHWRDDAGAGSTQ